MHVLSRFFLGVALAASVSAFVVPGASTAATSGYNDFTCKPTAAHPDPVVLLHGLGGTGDGDLGPMAKTLAGQGYCTYTLTYGKPSADSPIGGTVDVDTSAHEIATFIDKVLSSTGAAKVDLVGHSEGAFQSLYIPKVLGYAPKVGNVVALAPPTHGTTFVGLVTVAQGTDLTFLVNNVVPLGCPACSQLVTGGSAVKTLDNGPIAQSGVKYTIVASRTDVLVLPHQSTALNTAETAFVAEPGVHNAYVQDTCPADPVGHIGLAFDSDVTQMVSNALDPAHATAVTCSAGAPA